MRFYQQQHPFYCGVDLHARTMHVCIVDQAGRPLVAQEHCPPSRSGFCELIAPYRDGLVVGCECMFAWYWLADLCAAEKIAFVLGHALYMKAIHGGKTKNDQIDSEKIARLLARRHASRWPTSIRPRCGPPATCCGAGCSWCGMRAEAIGAHPEHRQPVQPAAARARSCATRPTAKALPSGSADPSVRQSDRDRPGADRALDEQIATWSCT